MSKPAYIRAGVIGHPIMHSRSPLLHGYWMEQQGIEGAYLYLDILPEHLEAALRGLHPLGFSGVNVTIPHKGDAMRIVDELDPVAKMIGAVSCIAVRPDGTLYGTNNDWRGFLANMDQNAPDWQPGSGPAVVVGAGGGARAICHALKLRGVPEIRLVNRTRAKAEALVQDLGGPITVIDWDARHGALEGAATLVNTTSCGMAGQPPLDLSLDALPAEAHVSDIVYVPERTPLIEAALARGNPGIGGLGMLIHQGPAAWELWFGITPEVTPELHELMAADLAKGS